MALSAARSSLSEERVAERATQQAQAFNQLCGGVALEALRAMCGGPRAVLRCDTYATILTLGNSRRAICAGSRFV